MIDVNVVIVFNVYFRGKRFISCISVDIFNKKLKFYYVKELEGIDKLLNGW